MGIAPATAAGLSLQGLHTGIRTWCSWRIYGFRFACAVPIRVIVGNWINCFAACRAIRTYTAAKLHHRPLRWAKTEHAYQAVPALLNEKKLLGENPGRFRVGL